MWYAMQIKSGNEELIRQLCDATISRDILTECFYPRSERFWKKNGEKRIVVKPLFPGYLFLNTNAIREVEAALWQIPELTKVLKVGQASIPIQEEEKEYILRHGDADYVFIMSRGYMVGPYVKIEEGAFAGYYGKLLYIDRHNRYGVMEAQMFGRRIELEFGLEITDKRDLEL